LAPEGSRLVGWGTLSVLLGLDGSGWVVWMIIGMITTRTAGHQMPNLVL